MTKLDAAIYPVFVQQNDMYTFEPDSTIRIAIRPASSHALNNTVTRSVWRVEKVVFGVNGKGRRAWVLEGKGGHSLIRVSHLVTERLVRVPLILPLRLTSFNYRKAD
jgi:hypothetical protein